MDKIKQTKRLFTILIVVVVGLVALAILVVRGYADRLSRERPPAAVMVNELGKTYRGDKYVRLSGFCIRSEHIYRESAIAHEHIIYLEPCAGFGMHEDARPGVPLVVAVLQEDDFKQWIGSADSLPISRPLQWEGKLSNGVDIPFEGKEDVLYPYMQKDRPLFTFSLGYKPADDTSNKGFWTALLLIIAGFALVILLGSRFMVVHEMKRKKETEDFFRNRK